MIAGNLGRDISRVIDDVHESVLVEMAEAIRKSLSTHPTTSICPCPSVEALAVLYEAGYEVYKVEAVSA